MQLLNKSAVKKTFTYTWYVYPVLVGLLTLIWIWGFQAFHQPSSHQKLTLFFAAEIKKSSFTTDIQKAHYSREKLRQVEAYCSLPTAVGYYSKLSIYLNSSDMLILDQKTIDEFKNYQDKFFVEMTDSFITEYSLSSYEFYTYTDSQNVEHKYGIKIKGKDQSHYLDDYMVFDDGYDYFVTLSTSSKNLGSLSGEANKYYDNAITYMKYLLELNQ